MLPSNFIFTPTENTNLGVVIRDNPIHNDFLRLFYPLSQHAKF